MASERLKELQKLQNEVELGEIQPDPRATEVNLGAGSYRVRDANEGSEEERKKLMRKLAADQDKQKNRVEPWKIYTMVIVTIISCLLLLWALFSGATPDKSEECLDDRRLKSKSTMDMCEEIFSELEYTEEYLVECGLISGGP